MHSYKHRYETVKLLLQDPRTIATIDKQVNGRLYDHGMTALYLTWRGGVGPITKDAVSIFKLLLAHGTQMHPLH